MACRSILCTLMMFLQIDCYLLVRIEKFSLSDGMVPEKGTDISMSCDFVEITSSDGIQALNILKGEKRIAVCTLYVGGILPCSKEADVSARYTFEHSLSSVKISIKDLQISDAGNWSCGFATLTEITSFILPVYSYPVSMVLSGSSGPEDLSIKGVNLTCRTSNCVYPAPGNIQWYYKKIFRVTVLPSKMAERKTKRSFHALDTPFLEEFLCSDCCSIYRTRSGLRIICLKLATGVLKRET